MTPMADDVSCCAMVPLPTDKLTYVLDSSPPRTPVVLLLCGSFNPPTHMHMRLFELASEELHRRGYYVCGSYLSPVSDTYSKPGLAPSRHRVAMCQLAARDTETVMVSEWEARRPEYTNTLKVLRYVEQQVQSWWRALTRKCEKEPGLVDISGDNLNGVEREKEVQVKLLCGADLMATLVQPGVWQDPDTLLHEYGLVCITREGTQAQQLLETQGSLLHQYRDNIVLVQEPVTNDISSSRIRQLLAQGSSVRYLIPEAVRQYIFQNGLYGTKAKSPGMGWGSTDVNRLHDQI